MVCPLRGKVSSTPIPALSPTSSAALMSSSMPVTKYAELISQSFAIFLIYHQADVMPDVIMKRVEAASGVHYTAQKEAPRRFEPIAPVGTNYVPVGKVDMNALRQGPSSGAPPAPAASKPSVSAAARPVPMAPAPASGLGKAPVANKAPADAWPDEPASFAPPPAPAASRPIPKPSAPVSVMLYTIHAT